ncbi:MAG: hypothetical protein IC227_11230 [Enterococcus lacertideformus]|uniref:Uncharacterized protein n=1 Tax=Enterococcus lacertideformus TaxID=2771493 RepID=A0A931AVR0_9ENTE|nr:hypothetical protein [Enterococcus lacertideformus]
MDWVQSYDKNLRTFNPVPSQIRIKAVVRESDSANGDDILAYGNDIYTSSSLAGTAFFKGDEAGSSVQVTYNVRKIP